MSLLLGPLSVIRAIPLLLRGTLNAIAEAWAEARGTDHPGDAPAGADPDGGVVTRYERDATTEFTRKIRLLGAGDTTTLLRRALNMVWGLSSNPRDITTVYKDA